MGGYLPNDRHVCKAPLGTQLLEATGAGRSIRFEADATIELTFCR